jgi:hypothetical protein
MLRIPCKQSFPNPGHINTDRDPPIQRRKLYDHPDLVEMYPGMFLEETKPQMQPGMGLCGPYTVTRAVFSDAVTLVRGDRFYTLVIPFALRHVHSLTTCRTGQHRISQPGA